MRPPELLHRHVDDAEEGLLVDKFLSERSQKRTEESWAPESSVVPLGDIARDEILSRWAVHELIQSSE